MVMASIAIRNLDDVKTGIRKRAAGNGRSVSRASAALPPIVRCVLL